MAKKIYYYKVTLKNQSDYVEDYKRIKVLFDEIFKEKASNNHLILIEGDIKNSRVCMDVLYNTKEYLFVRIGKEKDKNEFLRRNINNLESGELDLKDDESIEVFTYIMYSYNSGILSFLGNKSAANESVFNKIIEHNPEYKTEMEPLPNNESIRELYVPNSTLSAVTVDLPIPDGEYLEKVLKLDRKLISAYKGTGLRKLRISFVGEPYKVITTENETIRSIVGAIQGLKKGNIISGAKIKGKPARKLSQQFDLFAEYYSYPINVNTYKIENYEKIIFSLEEVDEEVHKQMRMAYNENSEQVIRLADRKK